jgi:hypothetical protein
MEPSSWILSVLIGVTVVAGFGSPPASDLFEVDTRLLAELWQKEHTSPPDPYSLKHAQLKQRLQALAQDSSGLIQLEQVGASVAGREIFLAGLGAGAHKILFWSQMHGNEPTATCSILDLLRFFTRHRQEPWVAEILAKYRLLFIPMLNPDGAEREERRNAQGIDVNRDARMLQTPEGQLLKAVRDRFEPFLGFNLHNQSGQTTVGDTGMVATIALLAVAADVPGAKPRQPQPEVPDVLAKRVAAVLYEALSPFIYGHISRYDDPYNPRAFGDTLTLLGTPVVLIESGGNPAGAPANLGVQLNFVGILAVLNSLSTGRIRNANPAVFDALKLNSDDPIYEMMLRNAWIFTGTGVPLFRGDIGIRADMRAGASGSAVVADLGDLGVFSAKQSIDCSGAMVTPGLIAWDPERSLFSQNRSGMEYLRRGITTILATAAWSDLQNRKPAQEDWIGPREVDWGFLVTGGPARDDERAQLQLATWLAAGCRIWIPDSPDSAAGLQGLGRVASWFGADVTARTEAMKYQIPAGWGGDPARILTRWTSEAARAFRLTGRGTIATGSRADLVIWRISPGKEPTDIRDCTPDKVILNGRLFDLSQPDPAIQGRFLGRR